MTKSELIATLAKSVHLPDFQSVDFMEVFLNLLRAQLEGSSIIKFNGIGEFRLVKINTSGSETADSLIEAVLFKGDGEFSSRSFLFDIPGERSSDVSDDDNLLNLSFDKPVMPQDSDDLTPEENIYSGIQHNEFLKSKALELFSNGDITEMGAPAGIISGQQLKEIISPLDKGAEVWDALSKESSGTGNTSADDSWEFGSDWKREVEEEEIFKDLKSEDWDFGGEKNENPENPAEITFDDLFDSSEDDKPDKTGLTPVSSMTRELQIDLSEFDDEPSAPNPFKESFMPPDPTKFISNQDLDSLFKKSIAESFLFAIPDPELKKEEERKKAQKAKEEAYKENEYSLRRRMEEDFDESDSTEEGADFISLKNLRKAGPSDGFDPSKLVSEKTAAEIKKKKSILWGVVSTVFVAIVGISLYVYRFGIPPEIDEYFNPKKMIELPPIVATVIERDYFVPVSYPYAPAVNANDLPVLSSDSSLFMQKPVIPSGNPVKKDSIVQIIPKTEASKTGGQAAITPVTKSPVSSKESKPESTGGNQTVSSVVKDNIFKEGDIYTVQVSSWPNKNKADTEVKRLSGLGYPAYIQEAVIPGRGKWYRVRVGKYYNLQEAEDMAGKLK